MTAAEALVAAQAANVRVELKGSDLVLRAPAPPPAAVLDAVKRHKPGIVALLRRARSSWTAVDWKALFHERAGIAEFDGRLGRRQAEELAFEHCIMEWLMRHPVRSMPGCCLGCGRGDAHAGIVLPSGTEATGHAWLHPDCWPTWHAERKADAIADLGAKGIALPVMRLGRRFQVQRC